MFAGGGEISKTEKVPMVSQQIKVLCVGHVDEVNKAATKKKLYHHALNQCRASMSNK